ncbi:hemolysin secretion protein D [Rhizobium sp. R72]|uniref:HlyD family type I secretion periplasmic adaptor subunit n=1 Tax=unclassified Rhizobium TaxID=2613769 RepID=UPI000B533C27|nr:MULTISPECIES: HlyD family type I secretion periplasmic adaptor subunit [unclassified Rhizobium]OWW04839.1 hemolysin secretion protein D [Rhizobium sp. R72]OWW05896.1 hemolysin secretion protein D [Rhizobium sp. R711]
MIRTAAASTERAVRRLTLLAIATGILLVGVLGGLASAIRINGAVIAQGTLVVDSYVKPVKHQKGGTVGQVFVANGDRVRAGQILIHLDDTQAKANVAIISRRLRELAVRSARLSAERDGRDTIVFPAVVNGTDAAQAAALARAEQRLFDDRRASLRGKTAQLRERVHQLDQQAEGLTAQQDGKRRAIAIINKELASLEPLLREGVIPATRVYSLQRDAADLTGELGSLLASTAEIKGKIAETELQIIQVGDDNRSEVSEQLRQAEGDSGEYQERRVAMEDELRHVDIRAPQDGIVHQLAVHASGAVVAPAEAIMQIVPDHDLLTPELKLSPQDVDQVAVGKEVSLRFTAFSYRTTPELRGHVASISADLTTDARSGQSYYTLRVAVPESEWQRLGALAPVAGMPVEAFIETGERTALGYLAKPFTDQLARAFREE